MLKALSAMVAMTAMSSVVFAAEPKAMTNSELDEVVAGWVCPPPPPTNCAGNVCGNNGWGNGEDGTNPGSFQGGTEPSKSTNLSIPGGGINENPTTSSGR
jgi:hypothetical protein